MFQGGSKTRPIPNHFPRCPSNQNRGPFPSMPPRPVQAGSAPAAASAAPAETWSWLSAWLGLVALCLLAYWPALHGGFLWDDNAHVTKHELRTLAGLARVWFEPGATQQYYPVLHSAFWLEHGPVGRTRRLAYHWLNVLLLHAAAVGLLVRALQRLAIRGASGIAGQFHLSRCIPCAWNPSRGSRSRKIRCQPCSICWPRSCTCGSRKNVILLRPRRPAPTPSPPRSSSSRSSPSP